MKNIIIDLLIITIVIINFHSSCDPPPPPEDKNCGLDTETQPCITFDVDAVLWTDTGKTGYILIFPEDVSTYKEGKWSRKATVAVDASKQQWAGWFIQYGNKSETNKTINMSDYKYGKLVFWIKSQVDLEIGIRSGNISSGSEKSKVRISNYGFQNSNSEWQRICIPIEDFTKKDANLQLADMKILFSIYSNSNTLGTNGLTDFWVDDVRWEYRANADYINCK